MSPWQAGDRRPACCHRSPECQQPNQPSPAAGAAYGGVSGAAGCRQYRHQLPVGRSAGSFGAVLSRLAPRPSGGGGGGGGEASPSPSAVIRRQRGATGRRGTARDSRVTSHRRAEPPLTLRTRPVGGTALLICGGRASVADLS